MFASILLSLVLFLVQSTVLIFAGLSIARCIGRNRAAFRQIVYRCTFAAVLVCPMISLLFPKFGGAAIAVYLPGSLSVIETPVVVEPETPVSPAISWAETAPVVTGHFIETPAGTSNENMSQVVSQFDSRPDVAPANAIVPLAPKQTQPSMPEATELQTSTQTPAFPIRRVAAVVFAIWGLGVVFFLAKIAASRRRSTALVRHAVPVDGTLETQLQSTSRRLGIRRNVRLLQNPFLASPCLLGIRKPTLLLPDAIPENEREVDAILVHELAHLLRHDLAWLLAMRLACALLFFQPLLFLLKRLMRQTSEEICDDEVLRFGVDSGTYAGQLLDVASKYVPGEALPDCVLPMASRKSRLRRRVERILDSSRIIRVAVGRKTIVLTVGIAALLTLIIGSFSLEAGKIEPADPVMVAEETLEGDTEFVCRVHDSESNPIPDAKVIVQLLSVGSEPWRTEGKIIAEHRLTTDSQGVYRFTVTDEQANDPETLIHIAAAHPDYISSGYIFEKFRTFRDSCQLRDDEERTSITLGKSAKVTGIVLTPGGKPAASVLVYASSGYPNNAQTQTRTDSEGRFTIGTLPGEDRLLYILPKGYAAISLELKPDDADLGTLQLQSGVVLEGRAADPEGKPVSGLWLSLMLKDSPCVRRHGHDATCRAAVTDADGRFRFRPVMPGEYVIETGMLMEYDRNGDELAPESAYVNLAFSEFWLGRPVENKEEQPPENDTVPFAEKAITITDQPLQQLEYRAMESVDLVLTMGDDFLEAHPNLTWILCGQLEGQHWSLHKGIEKSDENGLVLKAPIGLKDVYLKLSDGEANRYYPLRFRFSQNEAWSNNWYATLGNIEKDARFSVELHPYEPGLLKVACKSPDGEPLSQNYVRVEYENVSFEDPKIITRNGETVMTGIERHSPQVEWGVMNGQQVMWRYRPVLADEEFTLLAEGFDDQSWYEPVKQSMTLSSGETKELIVTLKERVKKQEEIVEAELPYFPVDPEGGQKLDALMKAADMDSRSDAEIIETVRNGLLTAREYKLTILRWFGNKYIWGQSPQNLEAIELMREASKLDDREIYYNAVYFGLSVTDEKTPEILQAMIDVAMKTDDYYNVVGRINWGCRNPDDKAALLALLKPHLESSDETIRTKAEYLQAFFLDSAAWLKKDAEERLENAKKEFGPRMDEFRQKLLTGDSETRYETITEMGGAWLLVDDSFVEAFEACATDADPKVRQETARYGGEYMIWRAENQSAGMIRLMSELVKDPDGTTQHYAVYFGLSTVRNRTEAQVRELLELALDNHEWNTFRRIVWGLQRDNAKVKEILDQWKSDTTDPERADKTAAIYHCFVPDDSGNLQQLPLSSASKKSATPPREHVANEKQETALNTINPSTTGEVKNETVSIPEIKGRVVDMEGNPLRGIVVDLASEKPEPRELQAETDADGRFVFTGPFEYERSSFMHEGRESVGFSFLPILKIASDKNPGFAETDVSCIRFNDGKVVVDADFTVVMIQGTRIRGRVIDDRTGEGAANLTVRFYGYDHHFPLKQFKTVTDAEGNYLSPAVEQGKYMIYVLDQSGTDETAGKLDAVYVSPENPVFTAPDLHVDQCGWIEGDFVDAKTQEAKVFHLNIHLSATDDAINLNELTEVIDFHSGDSFRLKAFPGLNRIGVRYDDEQGLIKGLRHGGTKEVQVESGKTTHLTFEILSREEQSQMPEFPEPVEAERQAAEAVRRLGGWYKLDDGKHVVEVNMSFWQENDVRLDNPQTDTDEIMSYLPAFPRLKFLAVGKGQATDQSAHHFAKLANLERLFIWDTAVSDVGASYLGSLKKLRRIHFSNSRITDESLKVFAGLPEIRELSVQGNAFTNRGLQALEKAEKLESLWWCLGKTTPDDESLKIVARFPNLKSVDLQNADITAKGFLELAKSRSLTRIVCTLSRDADRESPRIIRFTPELVEAFGEMTQLEQFDAHYRVIIEMEEMKQLVEKLPNLKRFCNYKEDAVRQMREAK